MDDLSLLRLSGIAGLVGSALYVIGDVLLLAPAAAAHQPRRPFPVDVSQDRVLRRRASMLEDLACLPPWRLRWGALFGVIGSPLTVLGLWLFYRVLLPAGAWHAAAPALLMLGATVAGPFVHGAFGFVGETAQLVYEADGALRTSLVSRLRSQLVTIMLAYTPVLLAIIAASIISAAATLTGRTRFPVWMAAVNPVTLTIGWLLLRRVLPQGVGEFLKGAGFNIAFAAWFGAMTVAAGQASHTR